MKQSKVLLRVVQCFVRQSPCEPSSLAMCQSSLQLCPTSASSQQECQNFFRQCNIGSGRGDASVQARHSIQYTRQASASPANAAQMNLLQMRRLHVQAPSSQRSKDSSDAQESQHASSASAGEQSAAIPQAIPMHLSQELLSNELTPQRSCLSA